jgi:S-disulfanyl-L-cysteine oxidoreductase SoxD
MSMPRTLLLAACLMSFAACNDDDDAGETADPDTEDTETFAEQVELGMEVYGEHCAECHGDSGQGTDKAPRLVGLDEGALPLDPPASRKVRIEQFVTVGDVAEFAVANMPAGAAGSLSTEEYLAVLAFDLKANGITLDEPLDLETAEKLTIPR